MTMTLEMESLKTRLRSTWMSGDYGYFAKYLLPGAMDFLKRLDVTPGTKMLDVACGAGQIAIPAARAGAKVTGPRSWMSDSTKATPRGFHTRMRHSIWW
jgi:2-polyprenyl-3-methyl-5-hydroxy-6-metoxy-1,4-benzoquinol methylase